MKKFFLTRHKKLFEQVIPDYKNDSNDIFFDDMIKDEKFWGRASFVKRNQKMIDNSDCCLFYYDKNYQVGTNKKSGTKIAFDYATKKNKKIINVFCD